MNNPLSPETPKETILLVDDEAMVRKLARRVLEMEGYTVLEAGTGAEAIGICESGREPIDLLITDVVMPNMNGFELGEQLAGLRPQMPQLFVSGYASDALKTKTDPDASIQLLSKPYSPKELARRVREMLDAR